MSILGIMNSGGSFLSIILSLICLTKKLPFFHYELEAMIQHCMQIYMIIIVDSYVSIELVMNWCESYSVL